MTFGYAQPFSFRIGPQPAFRVVRHGVTEITLSDGRLVRATLQVKEVKANPGNPNGLDVSYNVVAEVVKPPAVLISAAHQTLQ